MHTQTDLLSPDMYYQTYRTSQISPSLWSTHKSRYQTRFAYTLLAEKHKLEFLQRIGRRREIRWSRWCGWGRHDGQRVKEQVASCSHLTMAQQGYAFVDADDDVTGDGQQLEFKSTLECMVLTDTSVLTQ